VRLKILWFALFALLVPSLSFAQQYVQHTNVAWTYQSPANYVLTIPNATITVCAGTTVPTPGTTCSPTTTIYSSPGIVGANPFNADNAGNYQFWSPGGLQYVISVSTSGAQTYSYSWTAANPFTNPTSPSFLYWNGTGIIGETLNAGGAITWRQGNTGFVNVGTAVPSSTLVAASYFASPPATFLVLASLQQTTLGVGCSASSNSAVASLSWTDPNGNAETANFSTLSFTGNGSLTTAATSSSLQVSVGLTPAAINYSVASTLGSTGCSTTPQYRVLLTAMVY